MKIVDIRCAGLRGATPEGGWSNELRPEDCVHTLIAVHTDSGLVGLGSVFTNDALVQASLNLLKPLYMGESALEPETSFREAASAHVLVGTRWIHNTHDQRHRHRIVGSVRQSNRSIGGTFAGRSLSRTHSAVRIVAHAGASFHARQFTSGQSARFPGL